jgi:RNA polymerase sigma factor (sigma-70 family)
MARSPSIALLRTQTDERLVALARQGHERAFDAIVERYRRPLLRACRRFLPEARAEDALQQALLQAWRALQRGDEVKDLRAWLYRISHNTALNALRMSGYDHEELEESARGAVDGPEEEVERRAVVRQTLAGLAALPARQREALIRLSIEGASQEQVARDLGLSEGAVRQLVFRARGALRAAATAITPLPLAGWLAGGGGGALAAGGAGATLAKVGAVAAIAGGVASGPMVFNHEGTERAKAAQAQKTAEAERTAHQSGDGQSPTPTAAPDRADFDDGSLGDDDQAGDRRRKRDAGDGSRRQGGDDGDSSNRESSREDEDDRESSRSEADDESDEGEDSSGRDRAEDEDSSESEDRKGRGRGRGGDDKADEESSGSGSGGDEPEEAEEPEPVETLEPLETPEPLETVEPEKVDDSSGSGGGSGRGLEAPEEPSDAPSDP